MDVNKALQYARPIIHGTEIQSLEMGLAGGQDTNTYPYVRSVRQAVSRCRNVAVHSAHAIFGIEIC
jgi:hypothetical protein